jgi:hypothetical protein
MFLLAVGYKYLFRENTRGDWLASFYGILVGDFARNQFLAYVAHYMSFWRSDIVSPPILSSYLYWLILPIPRAIWIAKPYAAALQFNQHLGYSLGIANLAKPLDELFSGNAFGLIDEAMMNLGLMGFMLVALWGFVAARVDRIRRYSLLAKVALPVFYLLATLYPFNAVLMLVGPLFIALFVLDRITMSVRQTKSGTVRLQTVAQKGLVSR